MRKFTWLTAFAVVALLFGAPGNAFAHPNHVHAVQVQNPQALNFDAAASVADHVIHADELVSSAELQKEKCQHGNAASDCDACGACSASSAAIATSELAIIKRRGRDEGAQLAAPYHVRQAVLDLSRPPKSFA